jgi:hypothetical protein
MLQWYVPSLYQNVYAVVFVAEVICFVMRIKSCKVFAPAFALIMYYTIEQQQVLSNSIPLSLHSNTHSYAPLIGLLDCGN